MTENIIPASVKLAAKRGFIRTASQSLSSVIPISGIAIVLSSDWLLGVGLGVGGAVVSAVLAGTASALSIISSGIPKDYSDAVLVAQAVIEPSESLINTDAAVTRVLLRSDRKGE